MTRTSAMKIANVSMKYRREDHANYLKMFDVIRLRWRHVFGDKSQYNTNMFRNFVLHMWKIDNISLAEACLLLPEIKSINTQREFIYRLYDDKIVSSDVYLGTDKKKRDHEESYGRGKSSPPVRLSEEIRGKVDVYLDEAVDEVKKFAADVTAVLPPRLRVGTR